MAGKQHMRQPFSVACAVMITLAILTGGGMLNAQDSGFLPDDLEPITPRNMYEIQQIAMLGTGTVSDLVWSPDSQMIAAAGSAGVRILDVEDLDAPPVWLLEHNGPVVGVQFSADSSQIMSAGVDQTVRRWDATSGQLLSVVTPLVGETGPYPAGILSFDLSPDGNLIALGRGNAGFGVLNEAMTQELLPLTGKAGMVTRFSDDGSLVVSLGFYDGMVSIWKVNGSSFELQQDILHSSYNWDFALSHDNRMIAIASHTQFDTPGIQVLDAQSGELLATFDGERAVSIDPTGMLLAAMSHVYQDREVSHTLNIWDMETRELVSSIPVDSSISQIRFSPDGTKLAAGFDDGGVSVWATADQTLISSVEGRGSRFYDIALLDDQLLSTEDGTYSVSTPSDGGGSLENTLRLWDLNTGRELDVWERDEFKPPLPVNAALKQIPNVTQFVRTNAESVSRFETPPFNYLWTPGETALVPLDTPGFQIYGDVLFNQAGTLMVTPGRQLYSGPQSILIWDVSSSDGNLNLDLRNVIDTGLPPFTARVWALHPTAPEVLGVTTDGAMRIWNLETGEVVQSGQLSSEPQVAIYSSDGTTVFVNDGQWQALNSDTLEPMQYLRGEQQGYLPSRVAAVNHSGSLLAFATEQYASVGRIVLWDGLNEIEPAQILSPPVNSLLFSPDDRLLISTGDDGTIRFWGVRAE